MLGSVLVCLPVLGLLFVCLLFQFVFDHRHNVILRYLVKRIGLCRTALGARLPTQEVTKQRMWASALPA